MGSLTLKDLKESTEPYWTVSLGVQRNGTGQKPKGDTRTVLKEDAADTSALRPEGMSKMSKADRKEP